MPLVKELVAHILHHVNAEAATSDHSQAPGVQGRAQLVHVAVAGLVNDARDVPVGDTLQEIALAAPALPDTASFQTALTNMLDDPRPQLAIQAWVGTKQEQIGG